MKSEDLTVVQVVLSGHLTEVIKKWLENWDGKHEESTHELIEVAPLGYARIRLEGPRFTVDNAVALLLNGDFGIVKID